MDDQMGVSPVIRRLPSTAQSSWSVDQIRKTLAMWVLNRWHGQVKFFHISLKLDKMLHTTSKPRKQPTIMVFSCVLNRGRRLIHPKHQLLALQFTNDSEFPQESQLVSQSMGSKACMTDERKTYQILGGDIESFLWVLTDITSLRP